jgi:hypothetical protein
MILRYVNTEVLCVQSTRQGREPPLSVRRRLAVGGVAATRVWTFLGSSAGLGARNQEEKKETSGATNIPLRWSREGNGIPGSYKHSAPLEPGEGYAVGYRGDNPIRAWTGHMISFDFWDAGQSKQPPVVLP